MSVSFKMPNGATYKTPASLDEIKTGTFIQFLQQVAANCPQQLDDLYKLEDGENLADKWQALSKADRVECYKYFSEVVAFWTGAEAKQLQEALGLKKLELSFWAIELLFLKFAPDPTFNGFDLGGVSYSLPSENMTDATFIEFAEAAQFQANVQELKGGNFLAILDIMAVLCRPAGEVYDADKIPKRKKIFSSAPLSVAMNTAFFLSRLNVGLIQILSIYSLLNYKAEAEEATLRRLTDGTAF